MSVDRLFDVKNTFYLGNYQQCINEAQKLSTKSEEEKIAKEVLMYRAYIALGKASIPLAEIPEKISSSPLQAVRRLANAQNAAKKSKIVSEVESELSGGSLSNDDTSCIVAASILSIAGNAEDALRVLYKSDSLEAKAAIVKTLLTMDRIDQAIKELKKMNELDEDATLTQLAHAWVNMAVGKEKLKDAFYIFQEMMDKYGQSPLLLVGQASALILQEKYDDAEKLLQEAQQRDANNSEAIVNLIVVSEHLGKEPEVMNRLISQLKDSHPDHPFTRDILHKEELFDRLAAESNA